MGARSPDVSGVLVKRSCRRIAQSALVLEVAEYDCPMRAGGIGATRVRRRACGCIACAMLVSLAVACTTDDRASESGSAPPRSDTASTSGTVEDGVTLQCATDHEQILDLLRSGLGPYDFDPARDLADLIERTDLVVTGTIDSVVRELPGEIFRQQTMFSTPDAVALNPTLPDPNPVSEFSTMAVWGQGGRPDPLAQPVTIDGLRFVAFLHRDSDDPNAFVVAPQSLVVSCTDSAEAAEPITAPLPADVAELSIDELVAAVVTQSTPVTTTPATSD
jgi:hypothetical protein